MIYTDPKRIILFDTTLRDGEQALPQSLSAREKMQIALALEQLGVDVIETGFPVSSRGDFESVRSIASVLKRAVPCGLSRAVAGDIDACAEALKAAERFPHPHLHRHVRHSREGQAAQGLRQDPRDGRRGRQARPQLHGRRRIFLRGRGPHADRPSLPHGGGRDRCGRHDRQHSRHRGLHGARGVRRHHHDALQPRAQHRQGDHFGALPQRPRHGHGQLDHRHSARRAPDRVLR